MSQLHPTLENCPAGSRDRTDLAGPKHRSPDPIRIAVFLPDLCLGGAERQAVQLAVRLHRERFDCSVIVVRRRGELLPSLEGLRVICLNKYSRIFRLCRLIYVLRSLRIDILQSSLLSTNVYALLARLGAPRVKVVIGIRDSIAERTWAFSSRRARLKTWLLCEVMKRLASLASLHVSNSQAGARIAAKKVRSSVLVVPNGIDTDRFRLEEFSLGLLRQHIGVADNTPVVGTLANCSIYKDYATFLRAAKLVLKEVPNAHFVSIGENRTSEGNSAKELVRELGLESAVHFLGLRNDVEKFLPGLNVFCSSSLTEGFSNSICEAMSCGVPAVVTDVGDSALIVGDTGIVVPPADPEQLAAGITRLLGITPAERQKCQVAARQRIVRNFGINEMVAKYETIYHTLLNCAVRNPSAFSWKADSDRT